MAVLGIVAAHKQTLTCGIWDLVLRPGIKPRSLALGALSLNHWATTEIPPSGFHLNVSFLNQAFPGHSSKTLILSVSPPCFYPIAFVTL